MGHVKVAVDKKETEWKVVNVNQHSIKGLLKYRDRYDSLFDLTKSNSISKAIETAGINEFNKEATCVYAVIDDLISKCNFTDKQLYVLELYQQGLTENDIADRLDDTQQNINSIINTCVKKMNKQVNYDWLYEFVYWDKKKTNENWKQCNSCGEWKPESDFYFDKTNEVLKPKCKNCK